jgi:hypothetical protein
MKPTECRSARRLDLTTRQRFAAVCKLGSDSKAADAEFVFASKVSNSLSELVATFAISKQVCKACSKRLVVARDNQAQPARARARLFVEHLLSKL